MGSRIGEGTIRVGAKRQVTIPQDVQARVQKAIRLLKGNPPYPSLRSKESEVLDLVENGESIRVLRHGKAIAKIVPAGLREAKPAWKRPGLRLVTSGVSLSRAVLEERRSSL